MSSFKPEALKLIEKNVDKGLSDFTWDKLAEEFYAAQGTAIKAGEVDRTKEIAELAAKTTRSFYPNREKQWNAAFVNVTPEAKALEILHIATLFDLEAAFTLANRPVPPPAPEKPKKEGEAAGATPPVPPSPPTAGAPMPPAPPPAPVAAVPPPPAP